MLHKFNQKKIFLALLVLLLSASLTTLILQKFNKNYSLVKINEKKNNKLVVPFKFSTIKNFIILLYRHEFEKTLYNQ